MVTCINLRTLEHNYITTCIKSKLVILNPRLHKKKDMQFVKILSAVG